MNRGLQLCAERQQITVRFFYGPVGASQRKRVCRPGTFSHQNNLNLEIIILA